MCGQRDVMVAEGVLHKSFERALMGRGYQRGREEATSSTALYTPARGSAARRSWGRATTWANRRLVGGCELLAVWGKLATGPHEQPRLGLCERNACPQPRARRHLSWRRTTMRGYEGDKCGDYPTKPTLTPRTSRLVASPFARVCAGCPASARCDMVRGVRSTVRGSRGAAVMQCRPRCGRAAGRRIVHKR